jgi:hypothetical protein
MIRGARLPAPVRGVEGDNGGLAELVSLEVARFRFAVSS